MRTNRLLLRAAATAGVVVLAVGVGALPASARVASERTVSMPQPCFDPVAAGAAARGAANPRAADHRDITAAEQARIEARTHAILAAKAAGRSNGKGKPGSGGGGGGGGTDPAGAAMDNIPVYVHQMLSSSGAGRVSSAQIDAQIAEMNQDYAGRDENGHTGKAVDSTAVANTGVHFYLAGVDEYKNDTWHHDRSSTTYRAQTRLGGKKSLNIWLVDFKYLGIATFPWDYASNPSIDGIRVQWDSLPGGDIANYDLGKTATHEAGHWLGLYHTFQGGCTSTNDEVEDTPAQSSATTGCPEGNDTCTLAGLDPIHNYMDYSYDQCYDEFTPDQSTRISDYWTAYRQ
ncbi:MAG TPA: zinc metalloprotease [Marmoricola sp.]|jgi:hypothetical protein|nr:zinc metalloprotease [Marmoricola sp.]